MTLASETTATAASAEFRSFCEDLHPFVWNGRQEGRMRRGIVTFGRIARKRSWRPAAIMIALHRSDTYPGATGDPVEAFIAQRFAHALDLLLHEYFSDERATEELLQDPA